MSLIASARALDDERFIWRIKAATMLAANARRNSEDPAEAEFAAHVLRTPNVNISMLNSICAVHPDIASAVTVDELNVVSTEGVEDDVLIRVVAENFPMLAWEYAQPAQNVGPVYMGEAV